MLDTATARVCLMSQRADGRLMRATAPHAASYFFFFLSFEGQFQELSNHKLPLHTPSSAALEVSAFEAGWPVIDSDFK